MSQLFDDFTNNGELGDSVDDFLSIVKGGAPPPVERPTEDIGPKTSED